MGLEKTGNKNPADVTHTETVAHQANQRLYSDQASLPKALEQKSISQLKPNEVGFTAPWAMKQDEKGKLWIDADFPIEAKPGGTFSMQVIMEKSGVAVDLSGCGASGTIERAAEKKPMHALPVVEFTESGFTEPWALRADEQGKLWLDTDFSIQEKPGGACSMKVIRGKAGVVIDLSLCSDEEKVYSRTSKPMDAVPVLKITGY